MINSTLSPETRSAPEIRWDYPPFQTPLDGSLKSYLGREILLRDKVPGTVRLTQPGETADLNINYDPSLDSAPDKVPDEDAAGLQQQYFDRQVQEFAPKAWWQSMSDRLAVHRLDPGDKSVEVYGKQTLRPLYDGVEQPHGYDIYETGNYATEEELQAVMGAIEALDTFSGGALVTDSNQPRIVLESGGEWKANTLNRPASAFASGFGLVLNMNQIRAEAQRENVSITALLATMVVHELTHSLERKEFGQTGKYFESHFDYSEEHVPHDLFGSIHAAVTAKELVENGSSPVHPYGYRNPAEDLATSSEVLFRSTEEWGNDLQAYPERMYTPDDLRRSLTLDFMRLAAERAGEEYGNPGFVGSEIAVRQDEHGRMYTERRRQLQSSEKISGQAAMHAEMEALVAAVPKKEAILVSYKPVNINEMQF